MPKVRDVSDEFGEHGAEATIHRLRDRGVTVPDPTAGAPVAPTVTAYVNHGRWMADCPDDRNAQVLDTGDSRFWCVVCSNAALGGMWRQVVWPADRTAVEAPLEPLERRDQNWTPA